MNELKMWQMGVVVSLCPPLSIDVCLNMIVNKIVLKREKVPFCTILLPHPLKTIVVNRLFPFLARIKIYCKLEILQNLVFLYTIILY